MNSGEVVKLIQADGWRLVRISGSHHHYRHELKAGLVTIPHPKRDLPPGTLNSI
ncbi:addiction module toxin, HicA family [bacterium M00.F.Ca.ET.228.01.1.1]|nr:type II toxin-antitoxin system HicA family toxin [Paraburkholderia phenoliruptrix]TGP45088.1 addiction module toxin, HicA family [bacterium M00.F.Ca.ET.228.01.1.1]TGS02971.1 addiction module toxin, HicA family [bacterium M00.F.Ca.ET.191.01.1.1]TGU06353.1 addiction module toxin, HicA family [bacterium M00.F.Ca.ET.155.01.1.1]MBW0448856.1 type II toxin-antitoxin system HicA family toxin [Paraburkholderia phenoliruptrix]MBW9097833.1 type II toxin-antitoxin system HicA family toxin [Paraburkhold